MSDIDDDAVTHDCDEQTERVPADEGGSVPIMLDAAIAAIWKKLSAEERELFTWTKVEGIPPRKIAIRFGWPMAKIDRVKHRLDRHLRELRCEIPAPLKRPRAVTVDVSTELQRRKDGGLRAKSPAAQIYSFKRNTSLNPFFKERLANGLFAWALTPSECLASDFVNRTKHKERTDCASNRETSSGKGILKAMSIDERLKAERMKCDRIAERLHAFRLAEEETTRDLVAAEIALKEEQSRAILEERAPNTSPLEKKIGSLQNAQRGKRAELDGATVALAQQRDLVAKLESEIENLAHSRMLARLAPLTKTFTERLEDLVHLSAEIDELTAGHFVTLRNLFADVPELTITSYGGVMTALRTLRWMDSSVLAEPRFAKRPKKKTA